MKRDHHPFIVALLLVILHAQNALAADAASDTGTAADDARPNILFVVIDTLRRDHVGCYGYQHETTPHIDALAARGARLDAHLASASWTRPSVASMFTALPPELHRACGWSSVMPERLTTLAEALRSAGYATAGVTSNPVLQAKFGMAQGFEHYDDYTVALLNDLALFRSEEHAADELRETSPLVTQTALRWLDKHEQTQDGRPFFLFALYFDVHSHYLPPAPYDRLFIDSGYTGTVDGRITRLGDEAQRSAGDRRRYQDLYDGELRYVDEQLGRLIAAVDAIDAADNGRDTLIVFCSDHGEEFWDHGNVMHGRTVYEEIALMPCLISWPGRIPAGSSSDVLCSHLDLMPTLLSAAGAITPEACQGRDLLPALTGSGPVDPAGAEPLVFLGAHNPSHDVIGVRSANHKLIWDRDADRWRAFDLRSDPREQHDLIDSDADWIAPLRARLDARLQAIAAQQPADDDQADGTAQEAPMDPEFLDQLRGLGYLQ